MTSISKDSTGSYYQNRPTGMEIDVIESTTTATGWGDVSLGAIVGGVIISLILQFVFNVLGLSIGVNTINPVVDTNPIEPALGTAAVIWVISSTFLSLFLGGWVAGRLSNTQNHVNATLHGIITWALTSIILLAIVGSSIGGIVSGLSRIVGQGATLLTSSVVQTAPAVVDSLGIQGDTLGAFVGEFRSLIAQPAPDATTEETATTTQTQNMSSEPMPMTLADLKLSREVTQFVTGANMDDAQRQSLATQISERTSLSVEEATTQLDSWRQSYQDVMVQVEQTARDVSQVATDTLAAIAAGLFVILLIGAAAAAIGAYLSVSWHDNIAVPMQTTQTVVTS